MPSAVIPSSVPNINFRVVFASTISIHLDIDLGLKYGQLDSAQLLTGYVIGQFRVYVFYGVLFMTLNQH